MSNNSFAKRLLTWFDKHGRKNLPWQHPITPYRVWVSEIMLQQTQVETVIPYFERFLKSFPTVEKLARADIDTVLHHWTGLGYYARARNLHKCAQVVTQDFGGQFPDCAETLNTLPGIGPSTAAAIASIAFEKPTAICDGNVKRVLARHQAIPGYPGDKKVHDQLWLIAQENMPKKRCRDYTQAIMDLGATLCTRAKPDCGNCPVQRDCLAKQQGNPLDYPGKKPKKVKPVKTKYLLMFQKPNKQVWLEQRPSSGIWGGLWSFPELDYEQPLNATITEMCEQAQDIRLWPAWRHTFTHYHLDIHPVCIQLPNNRLKKVAENDGQWQDIFTPATVGLAAPVKKLLNELANNNAIQEVMTI